MERFEDRVRAHRARRRPVPRRWSRRSLAALEGVDPDLVEVFYEALQEAPEDFVVTCGVRTAAEQRALYDQGRTTPGPVVTWIDGTRQRSRHQLNPETGYGEAVDVAILRGGGVTWDFSAYAALAETVKAVAERRGVPVRWLGDAAIRDGVHFELD